jgi:phosphodiesterase/alkaline phosphatase D-like protein
VGRIPRHLGGLAVAAIALAVPASASAGNSFIDGVTAGEVTDNSAIIWGQTKQPATVKAKVSVRSSDSQGTGITTLKTTKAADDTVQTTLKHLLPGKAYTYEFCLADKPKVCSDTGKFQTAPKPSQAKTIKFAYSGDETGVAAKGKSKPFWGDFKAFKSMAGENNNFNIDFGDTIYSDPEVPNIKTALTEQQKWQMYRKKLAVKNMRTIRESTGLYNHWDDHEFINDFSIPENGTKIYKAGVSAFRTYEPVTYTSKTGIYRTERWGKNLELFFLDERSFRSAKASANHACDNPSTGQPDLAPTAPQNVRNVFAALVPSLSQPVSQSCLDTINDPNRTMLGQKQLSTFTNAVKSSDARWKVVMNETPMQQFYALPYDRWEGYAYERVQLLNALQSANVDHLVFLTTDTHANFANVVRYRTLSGDSAPSNAPTTVPSDSPYSDFITGPVATKPFAQEIDDTTGSPGSGVLIEKAFFKPQPQSGVGMECAQGDLNSYAEVTVTGSTLKLQYKNENGGPVMDADGTTPCGPYVLTH